MQDQQDHDQARLGTVPPPILSPQIEIKQVSLTAPQSLAMLYGGLLFLLASLASVAATIWWCMKFVGYQPYQPPAAEGYTVAAMINYYMPLFFNPLVLLSSTFICAAVGYMMLRAAGAIGRDIIPQRDYELLSNLLAAEKERSIDLYIKLTSLSGATGFFTKIGISGLPLATIFLTLTFTLVGLTSGSQKLLDFANLTLGAFLGSYVQKKVSVETAEQGSGKGPLP